MMASTIHTLLIGLVCFWCHPFDGPQKSAEGIIREIEAIRDSVAKTMKDPGKRASLREDAAVRKEVAAQQLEARRRIDDLTWTLYKNYPDHERVPELLRSRWMYRMRTPATADETLAEIDRVLAEAKSGRLANDIAFLRAEATLRRYRDRPAIEFFNLSMPSIESAIARAPHDVRGASLLYAVITWRKNLPEPKLNEVRDRILRDYPASNIANLVRKSRIAKPELGKPLTLEFRDAISGSDVSLASMRGKVVVIIFWATWCGPCVDDTPRMKDLYSKYHDQGVEFVGVSLDRSPEHGGLNRLREFVASNGIRWPQYYEGASGTMKFSEFCGVQGIPTTFILNRSTQPGK